MRKYIMLLLIFTSSAFAQITGYDDVGAGTYTSGSNLLQKTNVGFAWDLSVKTLPDILAGDFVIEIQITNLQTSAGPDTFFGSEIMFGVSNGTIDVSTSETPVYGVYLSGGAFYTRTNGSSFTEFFNVSPGVAAAGDKFKWTATAGNLILEIDKGGGYTQIHNYGAISYPVYFEWKPFETIVSDVQILAFPGLSPPSGAGDFTPFPGTPNPPSDAIQTKGGILTSDGSNLVEFPACGDGQVLIFDSGQATGLSCGAN